MTVEFIEPEQIKDYPGALIIDVRDDDYDIEGHFDKAINIPSAQIKHEEGWKEEVQGFKTVICYCMLSQVRRPKCAGIIQRAFPDKVVKCVAGGFTAIKDKLKGQIIPGKQ